MTDTVPHLSPAEIAELKLALAEYDNEPEALFEHLCATKIVPELIAMVEALQAERDGGAVICEGCGRIGAGLPSPPAVSCCPERNLITVAELFNLYTDALGRLAQRDGGAVSGDEKPMPLLGCPSHPGVPWHVVIGHEPQAKRNHSQTLNRLRERGGLSPCEMAAVLQDRPSRKMDQAEAMVIIDQKIAHIAALRTQHPAPRDAPTYVDGLRKAAQDCRYYFKHQNYTGDRSEYEQGVEDACDNLSDIIEKRADAFLATQQEKKS